MKPIKDEIINLVLEIFNVDKNKFWTNNGTPKISRNKTKYSKDDFLIILFSLSLNFSICLLKYFLNIFLKKRKKHKLPKTIVVILLTLIITSFIFFRGYKIIKWLMLFLIFYFNLIY